MVNDKAGSSLRNMSPSRQLQRARAEHQNAAGDVRRRYLATIQIRPTSLNHADRRNVCRAVGDRRLRKSSGDPAVRRGICAVVRGGAAVPQIPNTSRSHSGVDSVRVEPAPVTLARLSHDGPQRSGWHAAAVRRGCDSHSSSLPTRTGSWELQVQGLAVRGQVHTSKRGHAGVDHRGRIELVIVSATAVRLTECPLKSLYRLVCRPDYCQVVEKRNLVDLMQDAPLFVQLEGLFTGQTGSLVLGEMGNWLAWKGPCVLTAPLVSPPSPFWNWPMLTVTPLPFASAGTTCM